MNNNLVTLQRTTLRNLNPDLENVIIVGIIIGKQRPKKFIDTKVPNMEMYKAVWNFTLRDSLQDYVNVTYWGACEVVFQANDRFRTGDVVEVINPQITVRSINDYGEQFRPMVTSPYSLALSEKSGLARHGGPTNQFLPLLRSPTKPIAGFLPLRDIQNSGASIKDTNVDILAVIKGIQPTRQITTKNNDNLEVKTIEVFDHTCSGLKIEIWEPDIISRSKDWKPRFTVLFMTDLRVKWSNFQRQFIAKVTNRTIVTDNPLGTDVDKLLNYAASAPIDTYEIVDQLITNLPDCETIQDVMSIKQIQDRINFNITENRLGQKQFTALVFAFISVLDLDGLTATLMIKCGKCRMTITGQKCENSECPTVFDNEIVEPEIKFDTRIVLSDHTGTLYNCRFSGDPAEQALGCTAREFSNMSDDQKCSLKWKYLMERCAVRIAVLFQVQQSPVISILQLSKANKHDIASKLSVY